MPIRRDRRPIRQRLEEKSFREILAEIPDADLFQRLAEDEFFGLEMLAKEKDPALLRHVFDVLKARQPARKVLERLPLVGRAAAYATNSQMHKLLFGGTRNKGLVLLLWVSENGNAQCLNMVLREMKKFRQLKQITKFLEYDPLLKAVELGDVATVHLLMSEFSRSEQIEILRFKNSTIFRAAAYHHSTDVVNELVRLAVNPQLIEEMLLSDHSNAFRMAAWHGDIETVQLLIKLGQDHGCLPQMLESFNFDGLRQAILQARNLEMVDLIIQALTSAGQWQGQNARIYEFLCLAAQSGDLVIFNRLLSEVPPAEIPAFFMQPGIHKLFPSAAKGNNAEIIDKIWNMADAAMQQNMLLENYQPHFNGPMVPCVALHEAVNSASIISVKKLVSLLDEPQRVAAITGSNNFLLRKAISEKENLELVRELINALPPQVLANSMTASDLFYGLKKFADCALISRVIETVDGSPHQEALRRAITSGHPNAHQAKLMSLFNVESILARDPPPAAAVNSDTITFAGEMTRRIYETAINRLSPDSSPASSREELQHRFNQLTAAQRQLINAAARRFRSYIYDNLDQLRETRDAMLNLGRVTRSLESDVGLRDTMEEMVDQHFMPELEGVKIKRSDFAQFAGDRDYLSCLDVVNGAMAVAYSAVRSRLMKVTEKPLPKEEESEKMGELQRASSQRLSRQNSSESFTKSN